MLYVPVARIGLVSPERSRQIEGILLRMAQTGQLRGKVNEQQLIDLLEQVSMRLIFCYAKFRCSDCAVLLQADEANSKSSARKGTIVVGFELVPKY
jgi:Double-stranded DNA-binding domain